MRSCQPTLSKPRDGEVLSLYLEKKSTQGVPSWCKEQKYCSIRQRYKGHWQGRQRSSPTSGNLNVSEGSTPKPSGSKRTSSTNSGFLGDEAHKPPCFRRVYPKTFGFQANQFHKLWVSRGRSPQTSMFQKGLPQNLRVPSEPVPQTLGLSILESGCHVPFGSRKYVTMRPEVLRQEDRSRLSLQCESKIKNSYFGAGQQITYSRFQLIQVNRPKQATTLGISIRPLSISGKSTFLQVQTWPMPKKNPEKEISERRPVHAKPKGPATDKPVLMPTEASSVSPSGLAPTRENYFRPRAPLNPETSTRPRSVPGKFVLLQVIPRVQRRNREIRGKLVGKNHPGLGQDTVLQVPVERSSGSDPCIHPCLQINKRDY
ncbi:hypothetical protein DY000_02014594 [Brassica cretica]|uniref:Uncharacterized protein n=1 Tax=Brassica cretica TaxID=69181 RepID=A0ABQ7CTM1_BRACR|nr:hypothetical protein DY000_02014594 [Brassica cretica]